MGSSPFAAAAVARQQPAARHVGQPPAGHSPSQAARQAGLAVPHPVACHFSHPARQPHARTAHVLSMPMPGSGLASMSMSMPLWTLLWMPIPGLQSRHWPARPPGDPPPADHLPHLEQPAGHFRVEPASLHHGSMQPPVRPARGPTASTAPPAVPRRSSWARRIGRRTNQPSRCGVPAATVQTRMEYERTWRALLSREFGMRDQRFVNELPDASACTCACTGAWVSVFICVFSCACACS